VCALWLARISWFCQGLHRCCLGSVWLVGGRLVERRLQSIWKPLPNPLLKEREQNLVSFDIDIFFARKDNGWIGG
jgi:hypothetical protein